MDPNIQAAIDANPDRLDADVVIEFNIRAVIQQRYLGEVCIFCRKCKMPVLMDKEEGWKSCCSEGVMFKESKT